MVTKTFKCNRCHLSYDIEMNMNDTKARCPECNEPMLRVYNMNVARPSADNNGFFGVGNNGKGN